MIDLLPILVSVVGAAVAAALPIWAIVDAAARPEEQFRMTGDSKSYRVVYLVLTLIFCAPLGFIAAVSYLLTFRPALRAAANRAESNRDKLADDPLTHRA